MAKNVGDIWIDYAFLITVNKYMTFYQLIIKYSTLLYIKRDIFCVDNDKIYFWVVQKLLQIKKNH